MNLEGKTAKEKADLKGQEIAKIKSVKKTKRNKFDIEIVDIKAIEGGVEVFARAWQGKKQIGFGKDGSVDIERFIFINPPILVDDPNGSIVREWDEDNGDGIIHQVRKLREDPKEAILQSLEHTISVKKQKFIDSNIIKGKIGNTTTTVYSEAGTGTYVNDGNHYYGWSYTWSTVRNQSASIIGDNTTTQANSGTGFGVRALTSLGYAIGRSYYYFRYTLPSGDTIDSAKLSIYMDNKLDQVNDSDSYGAIVNSTNDSDTAFTHNDYNNYGTTKYSDDLDITSMTNAAYNDFNFNATGLAYLVADGTYNIARFGLREGHDIEDTGGSIGTGTDKQSQTNVNFTDNTGTTKDPKLVIEHSAAAGGVSVIPTLLTLGVG